MKSLNAVALSMFLSYCSAITAGAAQPPGDGVSEAINPVFLERQNPVPPADLTPPPNRGAILATLPADTNAAGQAKPESTLLVLKFEIMPGTTPLHGSIIRGKGFRVWADWQSGPNGTLIFLFQQLYRGMPLNEWTGGTGFPAAFEQGIGLALPSPSNGALQVSCQYDLHTIQLSVRDATGVRTNYTMWRDNMTDELGDDGPEVPAIDHPAISNVAFMPAQAIAPSRYVWEGVIGNTSHAPSGPEVHSPWWPILKMVSRGTNVFYTGGYNESKWDVQKFHTLNPQIVVTNFSASGRKQTTASAWPIDMSYPDDQTLLVKYSDGNVVAFNPVTTEKVAENLPDWVPGRPPDPRAVESTAAQTNQNFTNFAGTTNISANTSVDLTPPQTQGNASIADGLSISSTNGDAITQPPPPLIERPYERLPSVNVPMDSAIAVAVHPSDANVVAVYYHSTDQVVVYRNAATHGTAETNFVIGAAGGYANGPSVDIPTNTVNFRSSVKLGGYYYDSDGTRNPDACITNAVVCFQDDGKLWVSDTLTSRMLRFDTAGLCDSWFMFVAHTYNAYVDPNDPKRLFTGHLEFEVNYTNTASNCWILKNCWTRDASGQELPRANLLQNGLFSPITLTNAGRRQTFALARDPTYLNRRRIVELTPKGVRLTSIGNCSPLTEFEADGSAIANLVGPTPQEGTTAYFYRDYISGWAGADPVYSSSPVGTVAYADNFCPIYWNSAKLRGSKLYLFYPSKNQFERDAAGIPYTGSHLGLVDLERSGAWIWLASPTGPLNGRGNFETNCHYAGSGFTVVEDDIFFLYRGEGWRGGQANQIFHYKTDGTFVGQFGTPRFVQGTILNAPGAAANAFNISAVKVNGAIYLHTADEWSHGVHRWRIEPGVAASGPSLP